MQRIDIRKELREAPDLPALPDSVARLARELKTPDVDLEHLAQEISLDQAIAAKILRLVNSSFYGMPGCIGNLKQAVVVLGLETVQNVVLSVSILEAFRSTPCLNGFSTGDFWKHTIGTGLICQILARRRGLPNSSDTFVAGLLHDIGKLLLLKISPAGLDRVVQTVRQEAVFFREAERRHLTAGHAALGGWLAQRWHLPSSLTQAILLHHDPLRTKHPLPRLVHIANSLCIAFGVGSGGCDLVPPIDPSVWEEFGARQPALGSLLGQIDQSLQAVSSTADFLLQ